MPFAWFLLQIVLPVLFWAAYHYYHDRHLPEPVGKLFLCFLLGCGSAFIGQWMYAGLGALGLRFDALELGFSNLLGLLAYSMLAIGPIEEIAKLLPFLFVVLRFRAFDEPLDGIVYASFIALGYATIENLHYLQFLTSLEAVARGFAGPLVHVMFASIWGYYVARAFLRTGTWWSGGLLSVPAAAFLHGGYDFLVLAEPLAALPMAAMLMLLIWLWRILLIRGLHNQQGFEAECAICEVIAGAEVDGRGAIRRPAGDRHNRG